MPPSLDLLQHEKHLDRIKKLLAMAAGTANVHEAALAAQRVSRYLTEHPIPIRWIVKRGALVILVPEVALQSATLAQQTRRTMQAPKDLAFGEDLRVKDETQTASALGAGHLYFQRYGYVVLVPITHVEAYF